jgi:phosphoglycerate dehydrogenase-like enzyme
MSRTAKEAAVPSGESTGEYVDEPASRAKPKALMVLADWAYDQVYGDSGYAQLNELVSFVAPPQTRESLYRAPELLRDVEVLISGWGAPTLDESLLQWAPHLRILFYGAGTVRGVMTNHAWDRGIRVTTAQSANAIPVAEFTFAQIIFCLKRGWTHVRQLRETRQWRQCDSIPSAYGSHVGIISLGEIGRRVCEYLKPIECETLVYDRHQDEELRHALAIDYASLEEIFARCEVVSLHTPLLADTRGMIHAGLLRMMPYGASLINTARGGVIDEEGLIEVLGERPDLTAVLDVTDPEPPSEQSPLWSLPNVVLTPHIAGSCGRETRRLGKWMIEEVTRYVNGEPLKWELHQESVPFSA